MFLDFRKFFLCLVKADILSRRINLNKVLFYTVKTEVFRIFAFCFFQRNQTESSETFRKNRTKTRFRADSAGG